MTVKILDPSDKACYLELAAGNGSIFNSPDWLRMYGTSLEIYGIYNKDSKLIGAFHLYKSRTAKILNHYKNPPFTPHCGLVFSNHSSNKSNQLSFDKSVLNALAEFFEKLPYQLFTLAFPIGFMDMQAFIWKKFKVIPNYTYRLDLTQSVDELLKNLSGDKRNSINKSLKDAITVSLSDDLKQVKTMVEKTYSRKAKTVNEAILNSILFKFANAQNSFTYVAEIDKKPTALSFCIHDTTCAYYLLGGYDNLNKHQGAGVIALWNCILHAKNLGLKTFDFEGSMIPQVEKYFRGFGGDLIPYYTLNKGNIFVESMLKFIKRESF